MNVECFAYMDVPTCMFVYHVCAWYPQRPGKDIGVVRPPCGPVPLGERQSLLTTPSHHSGPKTGTYWRAGHDLLQTKPETVLPADRSLRIALGWQAALSQMLSSLLHAIMLSSYILALGAEMQTK